MSIKEIISKIVKTEHIISNLYSSLYGLELEKNKKNCMYSHYLNSLKDALKEEKDIFMSLSFEELMNLNEHIDDIKNALQMRLILNQFGFYIIQRIHGIISYLAIDKGLNNNEEVSDDYNEMINSTKEINNITNIVYEELNNIFLSFLDEEINNCDDIRTRNELIYNKYIYTFINGMNSEKKIIDREFDTDRSLYIDSEISAELVDIDLNEFYDKKNKMSMSLINSIMTEFALNRNSSDKYMNYKEKAENIYYLSELRTYFLLLDNDLFNDNIEFFNRVVNVRDKINTMFDIDIIEVLKKDRERHKYLSLKRK